MRNSTFITVWEGTDGSGKTTLMRRVARILVRRGYRVATHKTPGSMPSGKFASTYGNRRGIPPLSRMLLFLANTVDETGAIVRKLRLKNPDFLFIDRYYLCSAVYGLALLRHRHGLEDLPNINELIDFLEKLGRIDYLKPDAYVIVDVDEAERLKRLRGKRGRERVLETDTEFQNIVRRLYEDFILASPSKVIKIINETGKLEMLANHTAEKLLELRDAALLK